METELERVQLKAFSLGMGDGIFTPSKSAARAASFCRCWPAMKNNSAVPSEQMCFPLPFRLGRADLSGCYFFLGKMAMRRGIGIRYQANAKEQKVGKCETCAKMDSRNGWWISLLRSRSLKLRTYDQTVFPKSSDMKRLMHSLKASKSISRNSQRML